MEIKLTLNPGKLSNPDTDLRYTIPEMAEELSDNKIKDNGFDYDDDNNMLIFLIVEMIDKDKAIDILNNILNNLSIESDAIKIEWL